jgi:hypothetical protein
MKSVVQIIHLPSSHVHAKLNGGNMVRGILHPDRILKLQ